MDKQDKNIAVIGLGYVGLPLAIRAAEKGYSVIGIDLDKRKLDLLQAKVSPIDEEGLNQGVKETTAVFTDTFDVVNEADIVIICVPTPVDHDRNPDYGPVESAAKAVAAHLKKGQLIVLESTVNPGVCDDLVVPILEQASGMKAGIDFDVAHCPERINPGDPKWHVGNIPRVVGAKTAAGTARAAAFYRSIVDASIMEMNSLKEAEAVKVVENSFRNVNIAFVNELAQAFDLLGIDVVNVINGAATKPFAFMPHYPSVGVGGHCIPVDPYYLIDYSRRMVGFDHNLLAKALAINESMPRFSVRLLEQEFAKQGIELQGAKVAVLGLSYKKNVADTRESPAYEVIHELKQKGADVVVYDPYVLSQSTVQTLGEALNGAAGVLLVTAHHQFADLTAEMVKSFGVKAFIDGANMFSKQKFVEQGINYRGIGR